MPDADDDESETYAGPPPAEWRIELSRDLWFQDDIAITINCVALDIGDDDRQFIYQYERELSIFRDSGGGFGPNESDWLVRDLELEISDPHLTKFLPLWSRGSTAKYYYTLEDIKATVGHLADDTIIDGLDREHSADEFVEALLDFPLPVFGSPPSKFMNLRELMKVPGFSIMVYGTSTVTHNPIIGFVIPGAGVFLFWFTLPEFRIARRTLAERFAKRIGARVKKGDLE